jgi:S-adenosylmethionine decarboxylase
VTGIEWIVEAYGCAPDRLRDVTALQELFDGIVRALDLHPVGTALWHRFPTSGGITGVLVLSESHLACHSFPEHGTLCLNLFCCRARPDDDFERRLRERLGARTVNVRRLERPYGVVTDAPVLAPPIETVRG